MANTKTILGFIAGASLGAIAGILVAPDSGIATRKKITGNAVALKDAAKDCVIDFLNRLQETKAGETQSPKTQAGEEKIRKVMHTAKENQV